MPAGEILVCHFDHREKSWFVISTLGRNLGFFVISTSGRNLGLSFRPSGEILQLLFREFRSADFPKLNLRFLPLVEMTNQSIKISPAGMPDISRWHA
jgi:hypothetical protein